MIILNGRLTIELQERVKININYDYFATGWSLPDLGIEEGTLPPWGLAPAEISACVVDAHVAARGEDRHYGGSRSDDEEGEDSGAEEEEFWMLEAIETADVYRNARERDCLYYTYYKKNVDEKIAIEADNAAPPKWVIKKYNDRQATSAQSRRIIGRALRPLIPLTTHYAGCSHSEQALAQTHIAVPACLGDAPHRPSTRIETPPASAARGGGGAGSAKRAGVYESSLGNRFPDDAIKAMEFKFSLDDDEERFGKFVPDAENAEWHARKETRFNELTGLYLSHISHKSELLQYFEDTTETTGTVRQFEAEFGFQFEVDDNMRKILSNKEKILAEYTALMDRVDGNRGAACDITGNGYRFTVKNPFPGADERWAEFDTTLRRIYARCHLDGASPRKATLNAKLFVFDLPNTHPEHHDEHLTYYCQCRVWEADAKWWRTRTQKRRRGNLFVRLANGNLNDGNQSAIVPLRVAATARSQWSIIFHFGRQPPIVARFGKAVAWYSCSIKVRPAMRSAAPAVLPMRVSCYDTCVQFRAVPALSSLSAARM
ncbi:hypothetical protein B0H17DRAFT_1140749 [Mycena rosella]|uniref:Uncharacterized protein n=1 Tax=Mycena rosella TaxID=1033263 RepID=A0AAD7D129_MYCRO|nr:hypothetical protein B0H17DRAFT_1140749 [Mycena rosella]